jgi:hypothetical protein
MVITSARGVLGPTIPLGSCGSMIDTYSRKYIYVYKTQFTLKPSIISI